MSGTGWRDLRPYLDRFGNIRVDVTVGGGPGAADARSTGASATPVMVAEFLRDLAADIERAGETSGNRPQGKERQR